jgi:hypothetical protein
MQSFFLCLLIIGFQCFHAGAFQPNRNAALLPTTTSLYERFPKFDKSTQKWLYTSDDQKPEAGYPPLNTLLLHGPKPYFERIVRGDQYEQAVLKFMAVEKIGRIEAQGNMDAYLRNPNDWAVDKLEEKRTGRKPDYTTLKQSKIALSALWSGLVFFYAWRAIANKLYDEPFLPF